MTVINVVEGAIYCGGCQRSLRCGIPLLIRVGELAGDAIR